MKNQSSLFKNNLHLFTDKYPHYSYLGWEHFLTKTKKRATPKKPFVFPEISKEANCLLILGLEGEDLYPVLKDWLYQNPERKALLVLQTYQEFLSFAMDHSLKELLHMGQLDWLILSQNTEEETLNEWLSQHDYYRMEIILNIYSSTQKKAYSKLAEKLKSIIHLLHLKQIEQILFEKNLMNYLNNLLFLPSSGFVNNWKNELNNIPAIICGAGSSLEKDLPFIKNKMNEALIISTGSGSKALNQHGLHPHLAIATEPTYEEVKRFHRISMDSTVLVYTHRLNTEVVKKAPHLAYLFTGVEKGFDDWIKKEFNLMEPFQLQPSKNSCFSASILALAVALFLGCNPIIFCGMDLSFTKNMHYIPGIKENNEVMKDRLILKKDIHHGPVYTKLEFLLEHQALSSYLKQYPKIQFFYSAEGLGIKGAKNCSLEKVPLKFFSKKFDIRNLVQKMNESSIQPVHSVREKIKKLVSNIQVFIQKIEIILEKLEHSYPKALIDIHEMKEEENYSFLVEPFFYQWKWRSLEPIHGDEKKEKYLFILGQLKRIEKHITALSDQK